MKKSRIFLGIAALSLVVAGVFANKTAKKFGLANLYYLNGSTYVNIASPGCLASIFTTTPGTHVAQIKKGTGTAFTLYYNVTGSTYSPVYTNKF